MISGIGGCFNRDTNFYIGFQRDLFIFFILQRVVDSDLTIEFVGPSTAI